jgi:hypothetical protein
MADDALKKLEDRLTRLEAALSQQGGGGAGVPPGGTVVDPAPWGGGGGGWGWRYPYWPHPIVDPAVFHHPIVDSPVFHQAASAASAFGKIGPNVDPPPSDISRFSAAQLQASLHSIAAERTRLDAMETLLKEHLEKAKQSG